MTDRAAELALLAVRRHEATGMPLLESIASAIRQVIDEIGPRRTPGQELVGQVITPKKLGEMADLGRGTSHHRLKEAAALGLVEKLRTGRYRVLAGGDMLLAPRNKWRRQA